MITIDYLISDHKGAGRKALQTICDYADLTSQIVFLHIDSKLPDYEIKGSPEKDKQLIKFYTRFGFVPCDRSYEWEGVFYTEQNMERQPNDSSATVRIR
jgi:hypothetical protein